MAKKSVKRKIIDMLERLPDDIGYDRAIESVQFMQRLELGLDQVARDAWLHPQGLTKQLPLDDAEVPPQPHFPGVT